MVSIKRRFLLRNYLLSTNKLRRFVQNDARDKIFQLFVFLFLFNGQRFNSRCLLFFYAPGRVNSFPSDSNSQTKKYSAINFSIGTGKPIQFVM